MQLDVLSHDNHLLVVAKPPGLLSQADRTGDPDVLSLARAYLSDVREKEGAPYLGLVHRLDRPASGVMVLACTSKAARRLAEQFRERLVDKRYLAVVEGTPEEWGTRVDYLSKEREQVRIVEADHPSGKRAELSWQVLAARDGLSLVLVRPLTGRPHQIRVQMAAEGAPLLGDFRYGARRELDGRNLALHAYHLRLEHPTRREGIAFQAAPPPAWEGHFEAEVGALLAQHAPFTASDPAKTESIP